MATLQSIGYNLLSGVCVSAASCLFFGGMVRLRYCNDKIAPRTWARPTAVIQNALHHKKRRRLKEDMKDSMDRASPKARSGGSGRGRGEAETGGARSGDGGGAIGEGEDEESSFFHDKIEWSCYWFSWIPWAWSLTYREMYMGVPGTGTRAGGRTGALLKCNLDGIILARFQALCLRVCLLATVLCCAVLLPLNLTAGCADEDDPRCELFNEDELTDYLKTTIAHIPNVNPSSGTYYTVTEETRLLTRLFAVVLVAWVIYGYTCIQLWKEWIENLAMRRVFYFEQDHWRQRKQEMRYFKQLKDPEEPFQQIRPPWIPHPELRETVPNIALNSVLYELPDAPIDVDPDDYDGIGGYMGTNYATKRDWQLAEAAKFFDSCIPNQPGYSSSVAAVTILPEANLLASTWQKWIIAGQKVRRARYIKQLIAERLYELEKMDELDENDALVIEAKTVAIPLNLGQPDLARYRLTDYGSHAQEFKPNHKKAKVPKKDGTNAEVTTRPIALSPTPKKLSRVDDEKKTTDDSQTLGTSVDAPHVSKVGGQSGATGQTVAPDELPKCASDASSPDITTLQSVDQAEFGYSQVLGVHGDDDNADESVTDYSATFSGFEQTAAYSRAYADSAGGCCPRGHCTWKLRQASLKELLEHLKQTEQDVCDASERLQEARNDVSEFVKGEFTRSKSKKKNNGFIGIVVETSDDEDSDSDDSAAPLRPKRRKVDISIRQRLSVEQQWNQVDTIIGRNLRDSARRSRSRMEQKKSDSFIRRLCFPLRYCIQQAICFYKGANVCAASRRPTYAAVTFTSRQAAIAARQCLADASALGRWEQLEGIPVAPLADAPSCNIFTQYGICKPVTVAISDGEKLARRTLAYLILCFFYFFYTIPLSYATTVFTPEKIADTLPFLEGIRDGWLSDGGSSFLSGAIYTLFFFTCPFIFKAIANFGSGAISVREAEFIALGYYWWFMLLTAFTGNSLTAMVINGFSTGVNIGREFQAVLISVADVIPGQISAAWISWIIIKTTITMPVNYLCHLNTFVFECFRLKCCSRLSRGKAGGPIPFRIFVDTGVVNLCVMALAPACPLVSPIALLYYIFTNPILKWSLIFVYRPQYDDGGRRWPQLFNMMISAMVFSQMLLTTMLALKKAAVPALLSGLTIIPTIYFDLIVKRKFMPAYLDAGLHQTSKLDGWGESKRASSVAREEYRQWVVDCHKASFVPPCLAGADNILTAEPAVVIPLEYDMEMKEEVKAPVAVSRRPMLMRSKHRILSSKRSWSEEITKRQNTQQGAMLRRVAQVVSTLTPLKGAWNHQQAKQNDDPENYA